MSRLVIALAVAACGPAFTVHTRTSPQRVSVSKQASAPQLEVTVRFIGGGTVELAAKNAYDVRVTRVVHYGAASVEFGRGHPLIELIEIPLGLMALLVGPAAWEGPKLFKSSSNTKVEQHTNIVLAMLNPFQTANAFRLKASPSTNVDVFPEPPVVRAFRVSLPVPALSISFRALDDHRQVIASGTVETDPFGYVTIDNVAGAIALEVPIAGVPTVIPIDPEVAP